MYKRVLTLVTLIAFLLVGCSTSGEFPKVEVYKAKGFTEVKDSLISFTDLKSKKIFNKAVNSADKVVGIVDMSDPQYKILIGGDAYFLWLTEGHGTIMNAKDTNTAYSLTDSSTEEVNQLLN